MSSDVEELLSRIRQHPHLETVLAQFEVDAAEGLDEEEYEGESEDRSRMWRLCYELLSGKPMPERFVPDWVSPPGETLEDIMEEKELTTDVVMSRLGLSIEQVDNLLTGDLAIDAELALKLADRIGGTVDFWLRREALYRKEKQRLQDAKGGG